MTVLTGCPCKADLVIKVKKLFLLEPNTKEITDRLNPLKHSKITHLYITYSKKRLKRFITYSKKRLRICLINKFIKQTAFCFKNR